MLFVVVLVAGSNVYEMYQKEQDSRELRVQAENKYKDLVMREARLKEDIETLKTDRGMEKAIRQQYELAENGENLIVIVEPSASPSMEATSSPLEGWFGRLFFWR